MFLYCYAQSQFNFLLYTTRTITFLKEFSSHDKEEDRILN